MAAITANGHKVSHRAVPRDRCLHADCRRPSLRELIAEAKAWFARREEMRRG